MNWGAPFILLFMGLLLTSAASLSFGYQDFANDVAIYAFYSLVLGVALQIASYVKYGEPKAPIDEGHLPIRVPEPSVFPLKPKFVAVILVVVILIGGVATFQFYGPSLNLLPIHPNYAPLTATIGPYSTLSEPDGSTIVIFSVNAFGGALPYNFTAAWSDGVNQSGSTGVFQRPLAAGQIIPSSATVIVRSADGQVAKLNITIASK